MKPYPKYKDSGVKWIGEVPKGWAVKRIKYFFRLITKKNSTLETKKVALENIESWTGLFIDSEGDYQGEGILFCKGDVLFGKLRPYLAKVLNAKFSGASVGDIFVMRPKLGISSSFAFYRFLSKPFIDIVDGSTFGAKMPRVSWNFIANLPIAVPGYDEQTAIATYLDRKTTQIDNLISKKRKLIELLKEERAAIINQAVTKGLPPDVPMKDSGIEWLGEIPAHWEVKRLKYIARITLGKMLTNVDKGGYHYRPYLRAQNINWEKVNVEDVKKMWFSKDELHQYRLNKNDLLVSEGGEAGRTAIWDEEIKECYIQNSVHKVTMKSANDPFFFLYTFCLYGEKGVFESVSCST
jgi:type I restriction enzyme S subunit